MALRHRAYRAALFSNFATGWAVFGLRIALVPLFVIEVLRPRRRHGGTGAGDLRDRQRVGGDPQRLSVRPDRPAQAAHRRTDGVGGRDDRWWVSPSRCRCSWRRPFVAGAAAGIFSLAAAGRGGRHRRQQVARWYGGRDVPDDGRPRLDRGSLAVGEIARALLVCVRRSSISGVILLVAAVGWVFAPETRGAAAVRARRRSAHWARRPVANCRDLRF